MPNTDGFYSSREWYRVRSKVLKASGYRCAYCQAAVAGPYLAVVDHVQPRRSHPHLQLEPTNLQVLCKPCHDTVKQKHERSKEMVEIGLDGRPPGWV